ncbi:hypothetical protein, partial [Arcobacter sp. CECT 8985]|uniref:hypothetical protein n=1 Tax=Arcobacter sp. CECT 8985 TaxID=1935424 RepID=UPI0010254C91
MRRIKRIVLILGFALSSLNANSCLSKYEEEIAKGNAIAMNNFIKDCKSDLPENKILNYIKAREKKFFGSEALECRADAFFYQNKLRLAFDYYSQAESLNNQQAKISIGYIYSNFNNELKKEYEYRVDMPIYTEK